MAAAEGQGNKINLSMLIDFLLQKTYHELTVLAELLPRKTDIERKIEIVQFASRTRQQFVRLLALVKWASSADRVDKCQVISSYLDQQSMVFVDTADMLARMARETLVQARLPTFCLPAAVDVLTTGTYSRLPTCIRDKIVPPDPISSTEKTTTLGRLNQIIQHRLVTSQIPPQMSNINIGNGRVNFHVDHEFEVTLTIMGDDPSLPWRLLSIDILVQDIESGDGKPLVHDFQINYIHRLIQSRLFHEENTITDLYNCLHTFCLSLQLQVLFFQAQQLIHERWKDNIRVENSVSEQTLVLHYWRNASDQPQASSQSTEGCPYKLKITYKTNKKPACLRLEHEPEIKYHKDDHAMDTIPPGELSIEKVLIQTVKRQSNVKLSNLLNLLSDDLKLNSKVLLDRKKSTLAIQTCDDVTPYEVLLITIDTRSGEFRVALGSGEENPICMAMEKALNANPKHFPSLLGDVRCQLHLLKCRSTVAMQPVLPLDNLPISTPTQNKLEKLGKHHIFLQFRNHSHYFLVVDVQNDDRIHKVIEQYYLLRAKRVGPDSLDSSKKDDVQLIDVKQVKQEDDKTQCTTTKHEIKTTPNLREKQQLFLEAEEMVDIGSTRLIDLPGLMLSGMNSRKSDQNTSKRKFDDSDDDEQSSKKTKTTRDLFQDCSSVSSFQANLARLVSMCDSRIPLMPLCEQLHQHGVVHDGIQSEAGVGLYIPILYLPVPGDCDSQLVSNLQDTLLSCTVRFSGPDYKQCSFEMIFSASLFQSSSGKSEVKRVVLSYECPQANDSSSLSVVQQFMDDWCGICKLYPHALELELCLKDNTSHVRHMFHVGSYTYKEISLLYEPDRQNMVNLQWSVPETQFKLSFSHGPTSGASNPHHVMIEHLQKDFNKRSNLPYLMQILHETWKPLSSLNKLTTLPQLGVISRSLLVQKNFSILPQSPTSVFLIYRYNVLEIHFKAKNLVSIRDAALSSVDPIKTKTSLSTISNLKAFLQQFVDDIAKAGGIASRRGSEEDDEIPPSPFNMDSEPSSMDIQFTSPTQPMSSQNLTNSPIIPRVSPSGSSQTASSRAAFTQSPSPSNPYSSPSPASFIGHSPHPPYMQMMSPGSWSPLPGGSQVNKYRPPQQVSKQPPTPPRPLVAKSWGSTSPTILSHTAFNRLCTPMRTPLRCDGNLSQLEMFLGTMFLKKHLCRAITGDDSFQHLKTDAHLVAFNTNNFRCMVKVDHSTYTSQRLALQPTQENVWMREELGILERFFETRVACSPYKANSLTSFTRILTFPTNVLKDMIKIIRLEMNPDPGNKWKVEWCLTIPPNSPKMPFSIGTISVVFKTKLLIFIQLTRSVPQGTISYDSIVIPLVYDHTTNTTQQLPENTGKQSDPNRQAASAQTSSSVAAVNAVIKKFVESPTSKSGECTIFPTVLELARNLVLPPLSHMSGSGYSDSSIIL